MEIIKTKSITKILTIATTYLILQLKEMPPIIIRFKIITIIWIKLLPILTNNSKFNLNNNNLISSLNNSFKEMIKAFLKDFNNFLYNNNPALIWDLMVISQ